MNWNDGIRQSHRWLSIIFTATVMANFLARALATGGPSPWITYAPLAPLFLMLVCAALCGQVARQATRHARKAAQWLTVLAAVAPMRKN
jgi:hypothetical protein